MKFLKNSFFIGMAALSIGVASSSYADTSTANANAAMPEHHAHMQGDPAKMQAKMQEKMKEHQAMLHEKLKITPAQEAGWKTFTESMQTAMPDLAERKAHHDHDGDKLTTPQQMEKMLDNMKEHQQRMEQHLAALKTFYATLTPEQQKTFDEVHRHERKHFEQHHRMHHGDDDHAEHTQIN